MVGLYGPITPIHPCDWCIICVVLSDIDHVIAIPNHNPKSHLSLSLSLSLSLPFNMNSSPTITVTAATADTTATADTAAAADTATTADTTANEEGDVELLRLVMEGLSVMVAYCALVKALNPKLRDDRLKTDVNVYAAMSPAKWRKALKGATGYIGFLWKLYIRMTSCASHNDKEGPPNKSTEATATSVSHGSLHRQWIGQFKSSAATVTQVLDKEERQRAETKAKWRTAMEKVNAARGEPPIRSSKHYSTREMHVNVHL